MKKHFTVLLVVLLLVGTLFGCSKKSSLTIAIPNDTTNEARALLLLESLGYITLKEGVGVTATVLDIVENPLNIEFKEVEAAQIPNILPDVDYAVINTNFAISAGINPAEKALEMEGPGAVYANILAVKEGNENKPIILALIAALESKQVVDYINAKYNKSVVSTVENPTNGYNEAIDYEALKGQTVKVAASPTPHAEILKIVADILQEKGITVVVTEFNDYVVPNEVVEDGSYDANYFQHVPYLNDFNQQKGTHLVSVSSIHVEPMGLYGGKQTTLEALTIK